MKVNQEWDREKEEQKPKANHTGEISRIRKEESNQNRQRNDEYRGKKSPQKRFTTREHFKV
jgi:hypothetical protein